MLQTKHRVAGIIAAVATIFSALVVSSPASATITRPTVTASLDYVTLTVNVAQSLATRDEVNIDYKLSTDNAFIGSGATHHNLSFVATTDSKSDSFTVVTARSYDIRVQVGLSGSYSSYTYYSVTVPTAPTAAPTVITTGTSYQMQVDWAQTPSLSTGPYQAAAVKVYRDGVTTPYATVTAADGSTTTASYTGSSGHTYSFAVSTKNSSGSSVLSPVSNIITPSTNALPGAVEDAAATTDHGIDFGNGQIRVTWTDPTNTAGTLHHVKVEYKTTAEAWSAAHSYDASYPGGRYLVINSSNLVPGTAYNVRISASLNSTSTYVYGAAVELAATVTPLTRPAPATNLVATPGDGSVSLTWTAGNNGGSPITNYQIDYRLASTSSWSSATTVSTYSAVASATVSGLTNGSAYLFRVRAENIEGDDQTGIATATSVTPNPVPGGPVDLLGSAANSSVTLGWTAPTAANLFGQTITDYKVEYRPSTSNTWVTFAHTASVTPSLAVTGLANGIAYYFRVSTKTSAGFSTPTVTAATVTPTNSLGSPALDQVASTIAAGAVSVLDNQTNLGAVAVPTASTGVFRASAAGVLVSFKALDALGYLLPLSATNQLVVYAGQKVSVTATGLKAGSRARLFVSGTTASIGTALADANGKVSLTAKLPAGLTKAAHVLQLNGSSNLNNLLSASVGVNAAGSLLVTAKSTKFAFGATTLTTTEKSKLRELVSGTSLTPIAVRVIANTYGAATSVDKKRALTRAKAVAAYLKSRGVVAGITTVNNTGKAKSAATARNVVVSIESAIN